jgi:hypothetical protein
MAGDERRSMRPAHEEGAFQNRIRVGFWQDVRKSFLRRLFGEHKPL